MAESKGYVNYLDTSKFDLAIAAFKTGIEEYNEIKSDVEKTTNRLFWDWQGQGKVQFEQDYTTIYQQLTDIADIMYELYDALVDAESVYFEADQESAKMLTVM